eukprot:683428_1
MSDSDAFSRVSMSESVHTSNANDVLCDATLESSEICVSIRDESDFGSVRCGSQEILANLNLWYVGDANGYTKSCPQIIQVRRREYRLQSLRIVKIHHCGRQQAEMKLH